MEQNAALRTKVRVQIQNDMDDVYSNSDDELYDYELPMALWDDGDEVERCTECLWEVVGRVCQNQGCGRMYADYDVRPVSHMGPLFCLPNFTVFPG